MAGIMKTLWDESSELEDETLTPHSILSDDYTSPSDDEKGLDDVIDDQKEDDEIIDETLKVSDKK
ncbi:hypothetical protein H8784_11750 [Parabacteroides acidifaciens]|jgi:hypothetical protein|uniref:Uncharacterized protein n=1 Tax=Parabacteroides acidifaciens TaxID=2290935 RepID=A0A3D8HEB7_9BACT|nr:MULTISPECIES: hypothetical protein [Parabacteroides]MBC8602384.1 hypothetical protein [Parabacteroides acidifaciens]RDU48897.1 hypothetical protein DWU89_12055 [Parabacteroides acidifaciens]RHO74636.1 hypothetical protein DW083_02740 [Parabacteroides sp. AF48-14]RHR55385.1 hypothetical protein DWW90_14325 [Parabacteroides sp. AF17-28]